MAAMAATGTELPTFSTAPNVSTNVGLVDWSLFAPPYICIVGRPRRQVGGAYSQYRQGGKSRL